MKINPGFVEKLLTKFIKEELIKFDFSKGILGLSGGLDSAVCACLAAHALGKKNVIALIMPYQKTFGSDVKDAKGLAVSLGIKSHVIDISPMVDAYYADHPSENRVLKGNKMARERMARNKRNRWTQYLLHSGLSRIWHSVVRAPTTLCLRYPRLARGGQVVRSQGMNF